MANSVEILGMTFYHNEVLTSEKMNTLADRVDVIINSINEVKEKLDTLYTESHLYVDNAKAAIYKAIEAEVTRATAAEASIRSSLSTMTDTFSTFFRGTATNIDELTGAANKGIWYVSHRLAVVNTTAYYLLVTSDNQGNTFQFQFTGTATLSQGGDIGAQFNMRYYRASTSQWSEWRNVSGELFESLKTRLEKNEADIRVQKTTIDTAILNKELDLPELT